MTTFLIGLIRLYKKYFSPTLEMLGGKACRFTPTCSEYTIEALRKFGAVRGLKLGIARFLRCNPLGPSGFDPVPNLNKH